MNHKLQTCAKNFSRKKESRPDQGFAEENEMAEQTNLNSAQNTPLPERTVTFREDFSMGTLYVRNWDAEEDLPFFDQGIWKRLGPVRGKTTVPAGQKLGLWVKADDKKNFAVLGKLDQNDLQGLQISGNTVRHKFCQHLKRNLW